MPARFDAIDLFAGALAGGWDIGAHALGVNPLGIEIDEAACATREAAGLRTRLGDVASFDVETIAGVGGFDLLIASPPCTAFSTAGKREGIKDLPLIFETATAMALGESPPDVEEWRDHRSALVLEPLRWALALQPDYLAWEQVPPVLEFWQLCASILRKSGYSVWTGILYAEQYGVPQTRKRAILMASKVGEVRPPKPTHQRYVSPPKEDEDAPAGLFEVERADRIVRPEDRGLLPWISMAEALGWVDGTLTGNHTIAGGALAERDSGEPALTVGSRADLWRFRSGNQKNATERAADEPAPTVLFGHNLNEVKWLYNTRQPKGGNVPRPATEPAPTLSAQALAKGRDQWTRERPSTAVCGDSRKAEYAELEEDATRSGDNAIRVSLEEAAILQSFPPDFPFQGSKSQAFLQVGNAVPPALAIPILGELLGMDWKPVLFDYLATYTQPVELQEAA